MKILLITGVALLCTCLPAPSQATDQDRPVLDVIIVDVNGDVEGFLERMKRLQGVAKRLNLPATLRVFQGTFAAEKNGEIHLYWELPSFIAFAEAETALHNDEEFLAILEEMDAAGQNFKSELLTLEITKK
jgi:hypothetical protein